MDEPSGKGLTFLIRQELAVEEDACALVQHLQGGRQQKSASASAAAGGGWCSSGAGAPQPAQPPGEGPAAMRAHHYARRLGGVALAGQDLRRTAGGVEAERLRLGRGACGSRQRRRFEGPKPLLPAAAVRFMLQLLACTSAF